MEFVYGYQHWQFYFPLNLLISLSPRSVTTRADCCYNQQFNPRPSYFHHLAGGRAEAVHDEASPNENTKRTAIHHQLLIPRVRLARVCVPQLIQYMYAPPQNRPLSGDAKQILTCMGDAAALARMRMPEWSLIGGWGLGSCFFNTYAVTQGQYHPTKDNFVFYVRNTPDARHQQKNTVRYRYVLILCLFQEKPSGNIIFNNIIFRIQGQLKVVEFYIILYLNTDISIV